jgi:hypothetical protein
MNSQAATRNLLKQVRRAFPNLFQQVLCLSHRFEPVVKGQILSN